MADSSFVSISDEIEHEEQSHLDSLISSLASLIAREGSEGDEKAGADADIPSVRHEANMLCLLCLRVKINGQLIEAGNRDHAGQLSDDIDAIIKNARHIEREYKLTDDVLDHTWDLLMSVCPEHKGLLSPYFSGRRANKSRRQALFTDDLYVLFTSVARAYARLGKQEHAVSVLEDLCRLSEERNERELHREIVSRVLAMIGDRAPEATVRIARRNLPYFDHSQDAYAGDYDWLYACALQQLEKTSEAIAVFEKCYEVRRAVYGEDSWFTAIARREFSLLRYASSMDPACQAFLLEFVDNIESGLYGEANAPALKLIEGKTLYPLLMARLNAPYFENYDAYLRKYEEICDLYGGSNEPFIQIRLARNLRGAYYYRTGNYILAEQAFLDALNTEDTVPEVLTKARIKSNLLIVYYVQNDLEMAATVLSDLLDLAEQDDPASGLCEKDKYRIYTLSVSIESQAMLDPDQEETDAIRSFLAASCESVLSLSPELPACTKELAVFMFNASLFLLQNQRASRDELGVYLDALDRIDRERLVFPMDQLQRTTLNYVAALLAWTLSDRRAERFFSEAVRLSGESMVPPPTKASICQSYAAYSAKRGRSHTAVLYFSEALTHMEDAWKSYVRYLNDNRLMQILVPTQVQFIGCYAGLRSLLDTEALYEKALQFKALASLAAKERNRMIHSSGIDADLLRQIQLRQDKLAALEAESVFREVVHEYEAEKAALRQLESRFASQFPIGNDFTDISWNRLQSAIPDPCVVVEYVYCGLSYGILPFDEASSGNQMGFDIFITRKKDGRCDLVRLSVSDGEDILAAADEFLAILQAQSSNQAGLSELEKADDLRALLYKKLVRPLLPYIDGFETIYIAPDYDLVNLPFEILYDEEQERLDDLYSVIKIECARDFLFQRRSDTPSAGSLIIGNPQYDIEESDLGELEEPGEAPDSNRGFRIGSQAVAQLPFSQVETERIGKRCASAYYSGRAATKRLLMNANGYSNIHIATHGSYDLSGRSANGMYSSCLLFAGVCNWLKSGAVSKRFGNGMITADEVSRLDLRSVDLVVLSSCLSGMNDVSVNKGFHGMIGAFAAAGVRFVISHLWEANDFTSAILMDAFYFYYIEKKLSPQASLKSAKAYLRQVSIGQLRQDHWFDHTRRGNADLKTQRLIAQYEAMDDRVRPFKSEAYWGGYSCYQCC